MSFIFAKRECLCHMLLIDMYFLWSLCSPGSEARAGWQTIDGTRTSLSRICKRVLWTGCKQWIIPSWQWSIGRIPVFIHLWTRGPMTKMWCRDCINPNHQLDFTTMMVKGTNGTLIARHNTIATGSSNGPLGKASSRKIEMLGCSTLLSNFLCRMAIYNSVELRHLQIIGNFRFVFVHKYLHIESGI